MRIHVSSGIENWKDKLMHRTGWFPYKPWRHSQQPLTMFGMYRPRDLLYWMLHRGPKTLVWCGSDILSIGRTGFWLLQKTGGRHICENDVELGVLRLMLQREVEMQPLFFSNPLEFNPCYKPSKKPHVWMHINKNAELESGWLLLKKVARVLPGLTFHVYGKTKAKLFYDGLLAYVSVPGQDELFMMPPNIVVHGHVPEDQFNEEIRDYQCGIRLHSFDGMSEVSAKAILLGQHCITNIRYPHIPSYKDEKELIAQLKKVATTKPDHKMREHYIKEFTNPIWNG